jgi:hypothetical protein
MGVALGIKIPGGERLSVRGHNHANAEEGDVPRLGSGRPFHAENGYPPGCRAVARPHTVSEGNRGWYLKSRSEESETPAANTMAAAAGATRMRLSGLCFRGTNLNWAAVLPHRAAGAELRNGCRVEADFVHLVMAITGMRIRAGSRKQDCGEEYPEEEACPLHYPVIRHEITPALYSFNC